MWRRVRWLRRVTRTVDVYLIALWVLTEVLSEESVSETLLTTGEEQDDEEVSVTLDVQQPQQVAGSSADTTVVHDVTHVLKHQSTTTAAALVIQSGFRGMLARKRVALMRGERVHKPVITKVVTETLGGAVQVTLSTKELSTRERKRMKQQHRRAVQVLHLLAPLTHRGL